MINKQDNVRLEKLEKHAKFITDEEGQRYIAISVRTLLWLINKLRKMDKEARIKHEDIVNLKRVRRYCQRNHRVL